MTTPRPLARKRSARLGVALLFASGLSVLLAGCDPRALAFFLQPDNPSVAHSGPDLKGKRVVILARASADAQSEVQAIDHEIAQRLAETLRKKVKKIELVPQANVAAWVEDHPNWTSPAEAAEHFNTDAVVAIEIQHYSIENPKSPGLFEGTATVHVQVVEMLHPKDDRGRPDKTKPKEPEVVFEETRQTSFPRLQGSMPLSAEVNRPAFKQKFLETVVTEISWYFVDRAVGDTIQDTRFITQ